MTKRPSFSGVPDTGCVSQPLPVFVVTDHAAASRWLLNLFGDPYFHLTLSTSFAEAKSRLLEHPPALIVAAIQLGEFNGLGLVLRAKAANPAVRAVLLSKTADPVLQEDAERLGATFVSLPIDQRELRAAIVRTLFQPAINDKTPIRAPFERRRGQLSALSHASLPPGAVDRQRREALFPVQPPAVVHFDWPRADA
jgi:DNA-binding response OmpR family regulator